MKNLVMAVCLLSGAAFAQEIGTELPANQNPATPSTSATSASEPSAAEPAQSSQQHEMSIRNARGPHAGEFAVRASFFGNGLPAAPTSSTSPGSATPTLGFRYLATDSLAVDVDLGVALGLGGAVSYGFGAGLGLNAYLGSADKPIRPFLGGAVSFGKLLSRRGDDFSLTVSAGGGAEYWFDEHFSLDARLLIGLPINFRNTDNIAVATFEPGVGANFYF